jgi:hypothetical protein
MCVCVCVCVCVHLPLTALAVGKVVLELALVVDAVHLQQAPALHLSLHELSQVAAAVLCVCVCIYIVYIYMLCVCLCVYYNIKYAHTHRHTQTQTQSHTHTHYTYRVRQEPATVFPAVPPLPLVSLCVRPHFDTRPMILARHEVPLYTCIHICFIHVCVCVCVCVYHTLTPVQWYWPAVKCLLMYAYIDVLHVYVSM